VFAGNVLIPNVVPPITRLKYPEVVIGRAPFVYLIVTVFPAAFAVNVRPVINPAWVIVNEAFVEFINAAPVLEVMEPTVKLPRLVMVVLFINKLLLVEMVVPADMVLFEPTKKVYFEVLLNVPPPEIVVPPGLKPM
jgi:hypothetical protein